MLLHLYLKSIRHKFKNHLNLIIRSYIILNININLKIIYYGKKIHLPRVWLRS